MTGILVGLATAASAMTQTYGESLLDRIHNLHPAINRAEITSTNAQGQVITLERYWPGSSLSRAKRTLFDANGNEIGTLSLASRCGHFAHAEKIESELSRRIYNAGSLVESDPFVVAAVRAPKAQALVEGTLERDPALITLAFHVTPPGASQNMIVASSFGRIGKPGDADDEEVIRDGKNRREVTNNGKRVAIELPLLDMRRQIIGALSTSFRLELGASPEELEKRAVQTRDELARRIPSLKALFRPATVSRQVGALQLCHS